MRLPIMTLREQLSDTARRSKKWSGRRGGNRFGCSMLILTRKIDQAIVIKGNIFVRVLGVERDRVKLGICAPEEILILREELCADEPSGNGNEADQGDSPNGSTY
jgi:carbon storage regulator